MKKCSTALLFWALALMFDGAMASTKASHCQIRADAPDRHVVVKGDTLWGIAQTFLRNPWCWPHVWGINRQKIHDPHWIYPGQVIILDRRTGTLRLTTEGAKHKASKPDPIPMVDMGLIRAFLTRAMVLEKDTLDAMPHVIGGVDGRRLMGGGDKLYVAGSMPAGKSYMALRPTDAVRDPDTGDILGYEAVYLGKLRLLRKNTAQEQASIMDVTLAVQEITPGDKIVPEEDVAILNRMPRPSEGDIRARIVSAYGGEVMVGQNQVVLLDKGNKDDVHVGTVLDLYQAGRKVRDTDGTQRDLPEESFGSVLVFRVFEHLSYALVMKLTEPARVGDIARSPVAD